MGKDTENLYLTRSDQRKLQALVSRRSSGQTSKVFIHVDETFDLRLYAYGDVSKLDAGNDTVEPRHTLSLGSKLLSGEVERYDTMRLKVIDSNGKSHAAIVPARPAARKLCIRVERSMLSSSV